MVKNVKKIAASLMVGIFMAVSCLPMTPVASAALDAILLFDQSDVSASPGDTVTLVARVNPGTNAVGAVELDVTFNPSVLRLDSITPNSAAFGTTLSGPTIDNEGTGDTDGTGSIDVGSLTNTYNTTTDIATFVFTTLTTATDSPVAFAASSDASAEGSYVVLTRTPSAVTVAVSDTTAPVLSSGTPSGALAEGTTSTTVGVTTNENATCKYSTSSGTAYAAMANTFSSTGTTAHSFTAADLVDGTSYNYYVRCQDSADNPNLSDYTISFSVSAGDITAPVISSGTPSGELARGTTSRIISVTTNENATCKYSTSAGVAYASMTGSFTNTGETTHSFTTTGLSDGSSYSFRVRCQDGENNANVSDYTISFSIDKKSSKKEVKKKTKRKIYVSQKRVKRGDILVESGKRFSKNSKVVLYFSKYGGGYHAPIEIKTSASGTFSLSYKVNKPKGTYHWYAFDTKTGKKSKIKTYIVE